MRILITGGAGFVGSNLAKAALERGHQLCVFDNLSRHGCAANLTWLQSAGRFRFVHGDIRCASDVDLVVGDFCPNAVFHLAGQVAMTSSVARPRLDFETNAMGTFSLLESLKRHAREALFIYSSTNKVYRRPESFTRHVEQGTRYITPEFPEGFPETIPFDPETPYGVSKGTADALVRDAHAIFGLRTVVFRHSSIYGGRQFATFDQGWVSWFCAQALSQKKFQADSFTVAGSGKQVRDLLHADDLVDLYLAVLDHGESVIGEAFNVGGGIRNSMSILELLDFLQTELDVRLRFDCIAPRARDQKVFVADNTKIFGRLSWKPEVDRATGLRRTLTWLCEQEGGACDPR
ncbi:MAG: GDP-mannose 4,6-dehydratase [Proteobacteria bacterium]|nr:GDP-mannose 4,6-dehydratase [Pseudomonadota bacterium]